MFFIQKSNETVIIVSGEWYYTESLEYAYSY